MKEPLLAKPQYPIDAELQSGPLQHRPCRDPFFLVLFLIYVGFMTYIAIYSLIQGKPELLISPFDSSGHQCQHDQNDSDYANYPYVAIWKQLDTDKWIGTCVKGCTQELQKQCKTNNVTNDCSLIVYDAWTLGSICVPQIENDQIKSFFSSIGLDSYVQFFEDIRTAWPIVAASIGFSAFLSIVYVMFLQQCASCIIWGTITLFLVAFGGMGIMMLILPHSDALKRLIHFDDLPPSLQQLSVVQGLGITALCIFGVFLLVVLCFAKRINIAIAIIKAAGGFMKQNFSIVLVPIFTLLVDGITIMAWLLVMIFLASVGNITPPNEDTYVPFGWVDFSQTVKYYMACQAFGLLWILMFFSGAEKFIVSSSVAIWYYQEGYPEKPILRSLPRLVKSLGSIALGSLLIMITYVLRLLLAIVNNRYEKANKDAQNAVGRCCLKCAQCLVRCFQRLLEFITDKAYIMMAISGKSFCNSAAEGTGIIVSFLGQSVVVETSTRIFGIVGRLLITGATTFICLVMITSIPSISFNLFSTLGPVLSFILISFCVSTIFIQCFRVTADTLLMCYCIQKQFNGLRYKCPGQVRNLIQDYIDESSTP